MGLTLERLPRGPGPEPRGVRQRARARPRPMPLKAQFILDEIADKEVLDVAAGGAHRGTSCAARSSPAWTRRSSPTALQERPARLAVRRGAPRQGARAGAGPARDHRRVGQRRRPVPARRVRRPRGRAARRRGRTTRGEHEPGYVTTAGARPGSPRPRRARARPGARPTRTSTSPYARVRCHPCAASEHQLAHGTATGSSR